MVVPLAIVHVIIPSAFCIPALVRKALSYSFLRIIHFHAACQALTPMTGFDYDLIASCAVLQDKSGLAQPDSISAFTLKFHYDSLWMILKIINFVHKSYPSVQTLVRPSLAFLGRSVAIGISVVPFDRI